MNFSVLRYHKQISTHTLTWSVTNADETKFQEIVNFNSHAHVERDHLMKYWRILQNISTHTLTWSVTRHQTPMRCHLGYFNSHAHVERDTENADDATESVISTHTLTWSVTIQFAIKQVNVNISTHTLTWSVTTWVTTNFVPVAFQLTRSRGA